MICCSAQQWDQNLALQYFSSLFKTIIIYVCKRNAIVLHVMPNSHIPNGHYSFAAKMKVIFWNVDKTQRFHACISITSCYLTPRHVSLLAISDSKKHSDGCLEPLKFWKIRFCGLISISCPDAWRHVYAWFWYVCITWITMWRTTITWPVNVTKGVSIALLWYVP